ncbi:MAG: 50S ribosomal protein L18, partial [Gemmatimonadota bacterium]
MSEQDENEIFSGGRKETALQFGRVGERIRGTGERPRLVVSRSNRHMQGQIVDDDRGVTLTGITTRASEVADE